MEVIEIKQYDELPNALRNIDINFKRIMASITQIAKRLSSVMESEEEEEEGGGESTSTHTPPPINSCILVSRDADLTSYYPGTTWSSNGAFYTDSAFGASYLLRVYKRTA